MELGKSYTSCSLSNIVKQHSVSMKFNLSVSEIGGFMRRLRILGVVSKELVNYHAYWTKVKQLNFEDIEELLDEC
jgi:hypothetical protein